MGGGGGGGYYIASDRISGQGIGICKLDYFCSCVCVLVFQR